MRKLLTLFIMFAGMATATTALAQTSTLKGTITDTLNKQNLSNAVISVLRAKDSVLVRFT